MLFRSDRGRSHDRSPERSPDGSPGRDRRSGSKDAAPPVDVKAEDDEMKDRSQSPGPNGDSEKPDRKGSSPRSEAPDAEKEGTKELNPAADDKPDKKPVRSL